MQTGNKIVLIIFFLSIVLSGCNQVVERTSNNEIITNNEVDKQTETKNICPSEGQVLIKIDYGSSHGYSKFRRIYEDGEYYVIEGKGPVLPQIRKSVRISDDDMNSLINSIDNFDWESYTLEQKNNPNLNPNVFLIIPSKNEKINIPWSKEDHPDFLITLLDKYEPLAGSCILESQ